MDGKPGTAWTTDRYATPNLGGLKQGVGLLVDLGHRVRVGRVRLGFGAGGSSVRLYLGDHRAGLLGGTPVAAAQHAGRSVRLTLHPPAAGRWLLVWLTRLPPDPGGGYRGTVSTIAVRTAG